MDNVIIRTSELYKSFPVGGGEITVLKNINIDIPSGRLIIIKGRSGSGKTTLMNILSALDTASSGEVYFHDQKFSEMSDKERDSLRRAQIGFVFQSVALIPIMTAYENVDFGLRTAGYKGNRDERIKESLASVGLDQRMKHMPAQMSGGEQQRVAIARAMAHRPEIIFADEPTGAVDSKTSGMIQDLFRKLNREKGVTVIIVTHDISLANKVDRVVMIADGKIGSERIIKEAYKKKIDEMAGKSVEELMEGEQEQASVDTHEEYVILDRAGRLRLSPELREQVGIDSSRVKVEIVDGKIMISQENSDD